MNPKMNLKDFEKNFFSKRKQEKENFLLWINKTYTTILSVIVLLFVYYVWTLNVNATKWFSIRQLEIEKTNLLVEKELLDVKIAELESLTSIMKKDDTNNMEEAVNPNYIVVKDWAKYVYNYEKD